MTITRTSPTAKRNPAKAKNTVLFIKDAQKRAAFLNQSERARALSREARRDVRNDHHRQQRRPKPQPLRGLGIALQFAHLGSGGIAPAA